MITNRRIKIHILFLLILGSFLAVHFCFLLLPNVFAIWNSQATDQLFILRSSYERFQPSYDNTVVHVDLNKTSIQRLNELYLNRSHYAQVIRNLSSMRVAAQVFDFIFASRKSKENDKALLDSVEAAGTVYLGMAFEFGEDDQSQGKQLFSSKARHYLDQTKWNVTVDGNPGTLYTAKNPLITFPDLAGVSKGLGSLSVKFDRDGVLRRVPLMVGYKKGYYPLLPFRVICDYLNVPPEKIILKYGRHIILRDAKRPGYQISHDIVIPIDKKGNMIINYIGPWERMDHYNFADIYHASDDSDELEMWTEELEGKIVVVSDVSTGSTDIGPVPTDANFPLSGAHANIIHNILTEAFLRELSDIETFVIEVMLLAILLLLSLQFSSLYFTLGTVLLGIAFISGVGVSFFYFNVIPPIVRPFLIIVFSTVSINVYRYINEEKEKLESLRQRDFIRDTFGRYMSDEVVEELLDTPEGLKMSGENREITFLVSDLRGFTALTSKLSPNKTIAIMNRYFESMFEIIARYRGTVNELMGDGILIFFGSPLSSLDDPERAIACAIAMQNELARLNIEMNRINLPVLSMGIGINTGEVVVGNIGSKRRAKYGAVGMPINVAYRIESFTVGGQILVSPATYKKVHSLIGFRGTKEVMFKGIDEPVCLYNVISIGGTYQISLVQTKTDAMTQLDPPLPIQCFTVIGKSISGTGISGQITYVGESIAEMFLTHKVEAHTNIRIVHSGQEGSRLSVLYAKVLPKEEHPARSSDEGVVIEFTTMPSEIKKFFTEAKHE